MMVLGKGKGWYRKKAKAALCAGESHLEGISSLELLFSDLS